MSVETIKTAVLKSGVLAKFTAEISNEKIPREVMAKAVRHTLDSIGAAVCGAAAAESGLIMRSLSFLGESGGSAPILGKGVCTSPLNAALINGASAHSFELDDTGGCDHSGAVIIPAAFSALEVLHQQGGTISGREFLAAIVLGYELARRPLEACGAYGPHNKAGFHSTGTCGTFGAAAAAARILRLNWKETQMALGLAGSFSSGLWACVHDGAQSKRLHPGHAAYAGLLSASLAKNGFTGPTMIFEDVWGGFNETFAKNSSHPEAWLADLGKVWRLSRVSIKPHASCRSTHSSIDAVDILRKEMNFGPDDIQSIDIVISKFVHGMCGGFSCHPMPAAQLSIPYSVSADLIFGNASLPSFAKARRNDLRIRPLMDKIHFSFDDREDLDEPTVTVKLKDGREGTRQVTLPLGEPDNPISDEDLLAKFNSEVEMVYDEDLANKISSAVFALPETQDVYRAFHHLFVAKPIHTELFDI